MLRFFGVIISLLSFASLHAQTEQEWMKRGDSLAMYGWATKSIDAYAEASKLNPKNVEALAGQAAEYFDLGKFTEGTAMLEKAMSIDPKNPSALIIKARLALLGGKTYDAKKICDEVLSRYPKNVRALLTRALINEGAGSTAGAIMDYDAAVDADTTNLEARLLRADFNSRKNYYSMALRDLNVVVRRAPMLASAWYSRGMCYTNAQDWPKAIVDFDRCLALDSTHKEALLARATSYFANNEHDKALADYNRLEKLDTTIALLYYNRADLYYSKEDLDASCADCRRALRIALRTSIKDMADELNMNIEDHCDSTNSSYYYQRGISSFNLKHYDEAVSWYNRGLKKFPGNLLLINFRGNAQLALNHYSEAIADYDLALKDEPKLVAAYRENVRYAAIPETDPYFKTLSPGVRLVRAQALLGLGKAPEALNEVNAAISKLPEPRLVPTMPLGQFYFTRGLILAEAGKKDDALAEIERASVTMPVVQPLFFQALLHLQTWYAAQDKSMTLHFTYRNADAQAEYTFPEKVKKPKVDDNLTTALTALDKVIEGAPEFAEGWYVRGLVKQQLGKPDACADLKKASELGEKRADALLKDCK